VLSAISASFGAPRIPLPKRSANRAPSTTGHVEAKAMIGLDSAVSA
jgi:hypothetical protein